MLSSSEDKGRDALYHGTIVEYINIPWIFAFGAAFR
jgi:hypothetical protein